jgi:hypothetical protein
MFRLPGRNPTGDYHEVDTLQLDPRPGAIAGEPRWMIAVTVFVLFGVVLIFALYVNPF